MDIELRLTRTIDQFSSDELQIAKDREGPVFVSRETNNLFILTANLAGYKRRNIKIDINEAGNEIAITGEKSVQETIMVGIRVYKKDIVIKKFKKAFRIPDGVILDKINANFNDNDSVLTITMPKKIQEIRGYGIEEVDDQEIGKKGLETLKIADDETKEQRGLENVEGTRIDEMRKNEEFQREKSKGKDKVVEKQELGESSNSKERDEQIGRKDDDQVHGNDEVGETKRMDEKIGKKDDDQVHGNDEVGETKRMDEKIGKKDDDQVHGNDEVGETKRMDEKIGKKDDDQVHGNDEVGETKEGNMSKKGAEDSEKKSLLCAPIVAGSAILISLVVFVFRMIRNNNHSKKRD